jgi:hypothetical protein
MKIKIYSVIQLLLFSLTVFSLSTLAQDNSLPRFQVTSNTIQQGSIGYVDIQMFDIASVSAFDLSIFYDRDAFTVYNAESLSELNNISGIQKVMNTNMLGEIKFAVASASDFSVSGSIFRIYFQSTYDTPVNTYDILIAVGNVYNQAYEVLTVQGNSGTLNVTIYTPPSQTVNYDANVSQSSLALDDTFNVTVQSGQMYQLSASNFEMYYDQNHVEVVSVVLGNALKQTNMISEVNTSTKGLILIAFASPTGLNSAYPIVTVTFKVIVDDDVNSNIMFTAKKSYNQQLEALGSNQTTRSISITKKEVIIENPILSVTSYEGPYQNAFQVEVLLESNSNLAAGDFTITYDQSKLTVLDVTANFDGYIVFNHKPLEGKITFSILSTISLKDALTLLTLDIESKASSQSETYVTITGSGLVNQNLEPITLNYERGFIELSRYVEITFIDYDESLIEKVFVKENTLPEIPEWTLRPHTIFIGFDKTLSVATQDQTYKALYGLDLTQLSFQSRTVTYNGEIQTIDVEGLPLGATVEYINDQKIDAGSYFIEAYISLDGTLQGDKIAKLTIKPKTVEVVINNQTMVEFDALPEFTYDASGIYNRDEVTISMSVSNSEIGEHVITGTFSHPNYIFNVTEGILKVTPYDYILGDVTLDGMINQDDIIRIMKYMLGVETFNTTKITISDINQDGKIDILDLTWIQLFIDNKINSLEGLGE